MITGRPSKKWMAPHFAPYEPVPATQYSKLRVSQGKGVALHISLGDVVEVSCTDLPTRVGYVVRIDEESLTIGPDRLNAAESIEFEAIARIAKLHEE